MKRLFLAVLLILALSVPAAQACHYGAGYSYGAFASFAAPYVPTVAVPVYAPPVLLAPQQYAAPVCPQQAQAFSAPMFAPQQQFAPSPCGVAASFGTAGYAPGFGAVGYDIGRSVGYGAVRSFGAVGYGGASFAQSFLLPGSRNYIVRQRAFQRFGFGAGALGVQRIGAQRLGAGVGVQRLGFGAGVGARGFVGGGRAVFAQRGAVVAPRAAVIRTRTVIRR